MEGEEQIQDALYLSCLDWVDLYRKRGDKHERRRKANIILQLWLVRAEEERKDHNNEFPNIRDYIPKKQWEDSNITYEIYLLRFIGAITSYIEQNQNNRGGR